MYQVTSVKLMTQNGIQHAPEDKTFVIKQAPQQFVGPQMFSVLFTLTKSSFQLCQKHNCFAASAQNLCLLICILHLNIEVMFQISSLNVNSKFQF